MARYTLGELTVQVVGRHPVEAIGPGMERLDVQGVPVVVFEFPFVVGGQVLAAHVSGRVR